MSRSRHVVAEGLGTAFLVAAIVGSGIMAERLASGNVALALLANTVATAATLVALILTFGPISGAHFNPAVSLTEYIAGRLPRAAFSLFVSSQVVGAIGGTLLAHAMFDLPLGQLSGHSRAGASQVLSESVATFGLVMVIQVGSRVRPEAVAFMVGLYVTGAYWFTASTSFANPAVTVARALTGTFAGIRPADVPGFVSAQCVGALLALYLCQWLLSPVSRVERVGETAARVKQP